MIILLRNILFKILPILKKISNYEKDLEFVFSYGINSDAHVNRPFHISGANIGKYTYIDQGSWISQTNIGRFCSIGPNFLSGWGIHPTNGISTAPMFYSTKKQNGFSLSAKNKIEERKTINIGNDVFIGANVTVLDGVSIGDGAVIGAGAVVSKDIPSYAVAVGCPIHIIKYRFSQQQIESLERIQWWNFDDDELKNVENMFFDLDAFIAKYDK